MDQSGSLSAAVTQVERQIASLQFVQATQGDRLQKLRSQIDALVTSNEFVERLALGQTNDDVDLAVSELDTEVVTHADQNLYTARELQNTMAQAAPMVDFLAHVDIIKRIAAAYHSDIGPPSTFLRTLPSLPEWIQSTRNDGGDWHQKLESFWTRTDAIEATCRKIAPLQKAVQTRTKMHREMNAMVTIADQELTVIGPRLSRIAEHGQKVMSEIEERERATVECTLAADELRDNVARLITTEDGGNTLELDKTMEDHVEEVAKIQTTFVDVFNAWSREHARLQGDTKTYLAEVKKVHQRIQDCKNAMRAAQSEVNQVGERVQALMKGADSERMHGSTVDWDQVAQRIADIGRANNSVGDGRAAVLNDMHAQMATLADCNARLVHAVQQLQDQSRHIRGQLFLQHKPI
ncbi:Uncharacterized protein PBTT_08795 [Plasmodiophora brassicae]|uniref:Uncharacterized protein n=1 Tax=Plasmodiophora brassicae TaxID=37360 RepID=A0A3P3YKH7_PLABS|nr:unnamed protein product [Plasmodiophora brassicae]